MLRHNPELLTQPEVKKTSSHRPVTPFFDLPMLRNKVKIDDTLDVFAVHGVGGIFGTLMIAVFGQAAWVAQLGGLAIVGVFTVVVTFALVKICALITPLRVDAETEVNGLDLAAHGERAYDIAS